LGDAVTFALVLPRPEFEHSYRSYIRELGDEERYPFPLDFDCHDFSALLRRLDALARGENLPVGGVPSSTYWLISGDDIIGVSNLRHHLNENLRRLGGHIGLSVRPSNRGRGAGKRLLELTLQQARMRGIDEIHIHCYKNNVPSARMILGAGAVLESEIMDESTGNVVQRHRVGDAQLGVAASRYT